ncbi:Dimer-Tnp-hAT domain containing protein [Pyrenophora tritici-repentis]|nr:Dimer-Tnp-hAT domain containing protein [Pyrenophora tritici-repentis]KAI1601524.1 Dimer-Tnp-hAT domain containing protein [Pyrenophora tritici-repentis]PZC95389.1 Dimer-Tnp-hAT domain containing protein [Pyrenophora tritici-repentis]
MVKLRPKYPTLARFAIDILIVLATSCECERMFSELGDLLAPRRRNIGSQLLAALQCIRSWMRDGKRLPARATALSDDDLKRLYDLASWDKPEETGLESTFGSRSSKSGDEHKIETYPSEKNKYLRIDLETEFEKWQRKRSVEEESDISRPVKMVKVGKSSKSTQIPDQIPIALQASAVPRSLRSEGLAWIRGLELAEADTMPP